MSWTDPIVEEVRRVRDAYAARFNYDLRAIYRDLKEQEKRGGRQLVSDPVIQPMRPDELFSAAQQQQLADLLARWRAARDAGTPLPPQEQAELDALVEAELRAACERST